jgi:hypothetical protein
VEGGGTGPDGSPSCGTAIGAFDSVYYVHLGSTDCDDATVGNYPSVIAEHELAHALGLMSHFDGFTGNEGLNNPNMFAVIYNLYNNPIGATAYELDIVIISP